MTFDHIPGFKKKFNLGDIGLDFLPSLNAIRAEIRKCQVVCRSCHDKRELRRLSERLGVPLSLVQGYPGIRIFFRLSRILAFAEINVFQDQLKQAEDNFKQVMAYALGKVFELLGCLSGSRLVEGNRQREVNYQRSLKREIQAYEMRGGFKADWQAGIVYLMAKQNKEGKLKGVRSGSLMKVTVELEVPAGLIIIDVGPSKINCTECNKFGNINFGTEPDARIQAFVKEHVPCIQAKLGRLGQPIPRANIPGIPGISCTCQEDDGPNHPGNMVVLSTSLSKSVAGLTRC
jgi:hypothetical protein